MPNPRQFKRINYALAATLVATGVTLEQAAERCGAKNAGSLRVGLAKRGVTVTKAKSMVMEKSIQTVPEPVLLKVASEAGRVLRDILGESTLATAKNLATVKPGKSLARLRSFVDVLEPISRVGDRLYGWSQSQAAPTFNVLVLEQPAQVAAEQVKASTDQVIDLQEQPQSDSPQPEQDKPAL